MEPAFAWYVYDFEVAPDLLSSLDEPVPVWAEPEGVPAVVLTEWRTITDNVDSARCRTCPLPPNATVIGWRLNDDPEDGPSSIYYKAFWIITDGSSAWAVCEDCAGPPADASVSGGTQ